MEGRGEGSSAARSRCHPLFAALHDAERPHFPPLSVSSSYPSANASRRLLSSSASSFRSRRSSLYRPFVSIHLRLGHQFALCALVKLSNYPPASTPTTLPLALPYTLDPGSYPIPWPAFSVRTVSPLVPILRPDIASSLVPSPPSQRHLLLVLPSSAILSAASRCLRSLVEPREPPPRCREAKAPHRGRNTEDVEAVEKLEWSCPRGQLPRGSLYFLSTSGPSMRQRQTKQDELF